MHGTACRWVHWARDANREKGKAWQPRVGVLLPDGSNGSGTFREKQRVGESGASLNHPVASVDCGKGDGLLAWRLQLCTTFPLLPPVQQKLVRHLLPPANVLLIGSDGRSLLTSVLQVLEQLQLAEERGLVPHVHIGRTPFAPQSATACDSRLHDPLLGENAWAYFFEPVGSYTLGAATLGGRPVRMLVSPPADARRFARRIAPFLPGNREQAAEIVDGRGRAGPVPSTSDAELEGGKQEGGKQAGGKQAGGGRRAAESVSRARLVWRWVRLRPWVLQAAHRLLVGLLPDTRRQPLVGLLVNDPEQPREQRGGKQRSGKRSGSGEHGADDMQRRQALACVDSLIRARPAGSPPLTILVVAASGPELEFLRHQLSGRRDRCHRNTGRD